MKKLYLRIYLAVIAALLVFALAAGAAWRLFADEERSRGAHEWGATLAQNILPPASAPPAEQQRALERIAADLRVDLALYSAGRERIAAVGEAPAPPSAGQERTGWVRRWGGPHAFAVLLRDGRWFVAHVPAGRRSPPFGLMWIAGLLLAIGVGAYPVVRRLTKRLERLQAGVESLGAGQFSARVKVEGKDEVARLAESFNRAATRIEELVSAHRTLLANASHELRTPLARIRMAIELMKESADPKRRRDLEQDIAELDALIEEILLASRLDAAGRLDTVEEVDLLALAAEECARYEGTVLEGEQARVHGDLRLLRRMIRNLLENARRHGAPPVDVRITVREREVELSVRDSGPGVPEAERERVFEPFHRLPGAKEGAGLGLALVRQIARRHGGEARCAARAGAGASFVITFPSRS
jgi:signal transduction histidine kinase